MLLCFCDRRDGKGNKSTKKIGRKWRRNIFVAGHWKERLEGIISFFFSIGEKGYDLTNFND